MSEFRVLPALAALLTAATVTACAQPATAAASAPSGAASTRIQILTTADWADPAALAARASQIAELPVRDVSISSPRFFSLTLVCSEAAACEAGVQRLKNASADVAEIRPDLRRAIPKPIQSAASSAR